jgi:hypothetical protein
MNGIYVYTVYDQYRTSRKQHEALKMLKESDNEPMEEYIMFINTFPMPELETKKHTDEKNEEIK